MSNPLTPPGDVEPLGAIGRNIGYILMIYEYKKGLSNF